MLTKIIFKKPQKKEIIVFWEWEFTQARKDT